MMINARDIKESLLHLLFPHICCGCGSDIISTDSFLCMHCIDSMPRTEFHMHANNPVEKIFWGRLPLTSATAQYYFTRDSLMQQLMHQLKYKGNKELGKQLGRMIGNDLLQTNRFDYADALIPLPLFASKQKRRGYNQATVLCEGMAEVMNIKIIENAVARKQHTETQTKKNRAERWQNMEGKFELLDDGFLKNKYVLLVDDVVTTGATLEACGLELMKAEDISLGIVTLCYASR